MLTETLEFRVQHHGDWLVAFERITKMLFESQEYFYSEAQQTRMIFWQRPDADGATKIVVTFPDSPGTPTRIARQYAELPLFADAGLAFYEERIGELGLPILVTHENDSVSVMRKDRKYVNRAMRRMREAAIPV
jgi:hypothetical protein